METFTSFNPERFESQEKSRPVIKRRDSGGHRGSAVRNRARDIDVSSLMLRIRF